jgi:hypothetical protein
MRTKSKRAGPDAEFDAFRAARRGEMARDRRAAIDQLLQLAAADPGRFSTRDWAQATQFLQQLHAKAWLQESRVMAPNRIVPWPTVSHARIRRVHAELRRGLTRLFPTDPSRAWERRQWQPPITAQRLALWSQHRQLWRASVASWPDTIWVAAMGLLEEYGRQIHRCPTCPERRLFVKRKRQAYCSARCSQHARSARWYQNHHAAALERRHEAYVRQVLKGRKGVVARRPRKA